MAGSPALRSGSATPPLRPTIPSTMIYEVVEPVSGPMVFQEFLDKQSEGILYIASDCNGVPMG